MARQSLGTFLRQLRRAVGPGADHGLSDAQLLERFVRRRDEAAFEVLVWRHAALVLQVAHRLLPRAEDAEDAFQATFLTLARRAGSIRRPGALAGWLYQVAYRVALRARAGAARREVGRQPVDRLPAPPPGDDPVWRDLRPVLDEEIGRLPEKYRLAVVLCYLEGRSLEEAARQLGCPRGTVSSRLAGARERLRGRLTRRGLALSGAGLALALGTRGRATAAAGLVEGTVRAALAFAAGDVTGGALPATALAKGVLRTMWLTKLRLAATLLLIVGVTGAGVGWLGGPVLADRPDAGPAPALVPGTPSGLRVPAELLPRLGLQVAEVKARAALPPRQLELPGVLAIDPDRIIRVGSRLAGEVVEIGKAAGAAADRPLRFGDRVKKGEVLVVIRSKDLGAKKVDLLDAISQLSLDDEILRNAEANASAVPAVFILNSRRTVQGDVNLIDRTVNTLRTWGVPEDDIRAVRDEAEKVKKRPGKHGPDRDARWARLEIRAPTDGTVVEKNVAAGDRVDTNTVLFQIADLSRLAVVARAPEADVPALSALPAGRGRCTVRLLADPEAAPLEGRVERLGTSIDPNTATLPVWGSVPNAGGTLRAWQAVRVSIPLPGASGEVVVPAAAVVEAGKDSLVFVRPDPGKLVYVPRRVLVVRRGREVVHVRSPVTAEQERQGFDSLRPGERIVTAGAVELHALWSDLKERPRP